MANVLVSEDFLVDTYRLVAFMDGRVDDPGMEAIRVRVELEIRKKLDAKKRRQMFSDYKTAAVGSAAREDARKRYFDDAGIHLDWRSSGEFEP